MNKERRLAVLEAFAHSKPIEFEGFKHRWIEANPEFKDGEVIASGKNVGPATFVAVKPAPEVVEKPEPVITETVISDSGEAYNTVQPEPKKRKKVKTEVLTEEKEAEKE